MTWNSRKPVRLDLSVATGSGELFGALIAGLCHYLPEFTRLDVNRNLSRAPDKVRIRHAA